MENNINILFESIYEIFELEIPDLIKNLDSFVRLNIILISNYIDTLYELDTNPPFGNETKMSKEESLELVKHFYKAHGYDFNIDGLDITYEKRNIDDLINLREGETLGLTYEKDDELHIKLPDYGILLDSTVLVHEYSHSKNTFKTNASVNRLLTEAIAFSEELIYADYLENIGYSEDATRYKKETLRNFFFIALNNFTYLKVLSLYNHYPCYTEDFYEEVYGPSDEEEKSYEEEDLEEMLNNYNLGVRNLLESLNYTLACLISSYIYETYKEDKTIFNKLQNLHTLSRENTLEECLQEIGLDLFSEETFTKLRDSFNSLLQEVKEKVITINKNNINKDHNLV